MTNLEPKQDLTFVHLCLLRFFASLFGMMDVYNVHEEMCEQLDDKSKSGAKKILYLFTFAVSAFWAACLD